MLPHLKTTALTAVMLFTLGCAQLGIGIDEKPQGAKERFIAAMVDYEILAHEATIMVEGWIVATEQGDPLGPVYLDAAERIDRIRMRARVAIELGLGALAQDPPPANDLEAATRALSAILADLQRELLAGRKTALAMEATPWTR